MLERLPNYVSDPELIDELRSKYLTILLNHFPQIDPKQIRDAQAKYEIAGLDEYTKLTLCELSKEILDLFEDTTIVPVNQQESFTSFLEEMENVYSINENDDVINEPAKDPNVLSAPAALTVTIAALQATKTDSHKIEAELISDFRIALALLYKAVYPAIPYDLEKFLTDEDRRKIELQITKKLLKMVQQTRRKKAKEALPETHVYNTRENLRGIERINEIIKKQKNEQFHRDFKRLNRSNKERKQRYDDFLKAHGDPSKFTILFSQ